jgi:hypothetical protein
VRSDAAGKDLDRLLQGLSPALREGEFVFCTVPGGGYGDHAALAPLAAFTEAEGLTLVLPFEQARGAGLAGGPVMRCITLGVHSSLEAVGLTAAVAGALAGHGISANVIAAYHHDHVFVPAGRAEEALAVLLDVSC